MKIVEFVGRLKRFTKRNKVQWRFCGEAIRTVDPCLCPIEAVARVGEAEFEDGAKKLGLTRRQRGSITAAADNTYARPKLRVQLLDATGLAKAA
jgi:hypothetical protein